MSQACWPAAADGRYWIDTVVGGQNVRCMVDLGLIDPLGWLGLELEPALYDRLKQLGQLTSFKYRSRRDASGQLVWLESGETRAQLCDPTSQQPVGPVAQLFVGRGAASLPNRVGVVFFHRLPGCKVAWDLDTRLWYIEYP
jgi:hypothetical protein